MEGGVLSREFRLRLAEKLVSSGDLRSTEWRKAVESVPRETFLPQYFRHSSDSDGSS